MTSTMSTEPSSVSEETAGSGRPEWVIQTNSVYFNSAVSVWHNTDSTL